MYHKLHVIVPLRTIRVKKIQPAVQFVIVSFYVWIEALPTGVGVPVSDFVLVTITGREAEYLP